MPEPATTTVTDQADTHDTNTIMCEVCGWTWGMICPECAKGCGCETRCTGWRHNEFANAYEADPAEFEVHCPDCGGSYDSRHGPDGYNCSC